MEEIWKPIKDYEELYEVSNLGNVRSIDRTIIYNGKPHLHKGKRLSFSYNNNYTNVHLSKYGRSKLKTVHRLVADAFIPNLNNSPQVNHIDGDKQNNKVENLEWCDRSYNMHHAYKNNLVNHYVKKVDQFDTDGNHIKKWKSGTEASKNTGILLNQIIACCRGRIKTSGGYIWRYSND